MTKYAVILSPVVCLLLTVARPVYAQAGGAQARLQQISAFVGPAATQYLRKNLYLLENCTVGDVPDPDGTSPSAQTSPRIQSYRQVYEHNGRTTDRTSNHGIKSYMADSIASEPDFFQAAFGFYRWLRDEDYRWRETSRDKLEPMMTLGPSPINVAPSSRNIYETALSFANGNHYMATKILALYGHDNMVNSLQDETEDCRAIILDSFKPSSSSQLYQSGAISSLPYSASQLNQANRVAQNCVDAFRALESSGSSLRSAFQYMCNDGYDQYQSDYYHVLASAFITCRGEVARNQTSTTAMIVTNPALLAIDESASAARIAAIRGYKMARFQEEIARAGLPDRMKIYLRYALAKISINIDPFDTTWLVLSATISNVEADMLKAIVRRYWFEINFRSYQNTLGAQFAIRHCSNITGYSASHSNTTHEFHAREQGEKATGVLPPTAAGKSNGTGL